MAETARLMETQPNPEQVLDAIVHAASTTVPGFEHAGISIVHRGGRIETVAATAQFVVDLDELQYTLEEGPCLDAMRGEPMVPVPNAQHDQRWPRYMPQAAQRGLRAQLGVRLFDHQGRLAGLNLYSLVNDTIDDEASHIADLFATHAALALGHARDLESLNAALETRKTIGQAIGILMERFRIDEDRAFQFLVRSSQDTNIQVRELAAKLVHQTSEQHQSRGTARN